MDGGHPSAHTVCTTCPYCGVGCGLQVRVSDAAPLSIRGDADHPANLGRLCSKGSALGETLGLEDRLLQPRINGRNAEWNEALQLVASRFRRVIQDHGPDRVAFYVSGQLLTEDYYVANKLMKGFIGSANIDTNSRLCMASSVAGHRRAFGTDTVPGQYEDLEQADLVVLVGSNLAWCHPVIFQRLMKARSQNPDLKIVVVDPRRTATAESADLFLSIAPGSDIALFNGLLAHLADTGRISTGYTTACVTGLADSIEAARSDTPEATGLTPAELQAFYTLWAETEKVVTVYSQGVNQSSRGSDKVNSILNCHLATGRIGTPGCGPFSVTGQPNAMGGREVGGLANMLACHLDLENADHRATVREFWDAPSIPSRPGLKAVDMFQAVGRGEIKALWIIHTNPAVSMPDASAVRAAIESCDFTVVSDITDRTDTARLADVLLPATAWGEKDGTVTNSERCISRQRPFLPAPGEARADWDILAEVGRRMGFGGAFDYRSPAEIFREYASLSGLAGALGRDFDISSLSTVSDADYDAMTPAVWPLTPNRQGGRFFGEGGFYTPDGKARMLPVRHGDTATPVCSDHPFLLNTGRVRDHWHTMTRTAKSARLSSHLAEPFVEVHPSDAESLGLLAAGLAVVENAFGTALLRVLVTDRVAPGHLFAPMHWTGETSSAGRIDDLVAPVTDPVSGQPESKATPCSVAPYPARSFGFALSVDEPFPTAGYWAKARSEAGWTVELAEPTIPEDWDTYFRRLFALDNDLPLLTVSDPRRGTVRLAAIRDGRLIAALFISKEPVAVSRRFLASLLDSNTGPSVLAGLPGEDRPDPGATVCACFGVGITSIVTAIHEQSLTSVEEIGAALEAGTNCGSCKPELATLLTNTLTEAAE